jgi:hypothetical protein
MEREAAAGSKSVRRHARRKRSKGKELGRETGEILECVLAMWVVLECTTRVQVNFREHGSAISLPAGTGTPSQGASYY